MQKLLREYLDEVSKRQKKNRRAGIAVTLLVVLVVVAIAGILGQYGVAMTGTARCGLEEHQHTEECYEQVLTCGMEEGEEHTHTDDCYTQELVCEKEEHVHADICYVDPDADVEEQAVWDSQYADAEWQGAWGADLAAAASKQIGYKESVDNYDVAENGSHKGYTRYGQFVGDVYCDWDAAFVNFCIHYAGLEESGFFPNETDTAKWQEAFGQIREENAAYLTAPESYIPAAGDIVFFQRENEETSVQMGIVSSVNEENETITVIEGNCGNEVKENEYNLNEDNGISSYIKVTEMESAYKAIEEPETLAEEAEEAESETLAEETAATEEPAFAEQLTYEDEKVIVTVGAAEAGIIPQGAALQVLPIEADNADMAEQYKDVESKLQEKATEEEYDIAGFLAYDISLVDQDGNKMEPNGEVKVVMDYKEAAIPEELKGAETEHLDVTVIHLEENEQGEVEKVTDLSLVETEESEEPETKIEVLETTQAKEVEKTIFEADSFSVWAQVWYIDQNNNGYWKNTPIEKELNLNSVPTVTNSAIHIKMINHDGKQFGGGEWVRGTKQGITQGLLSNTLSSGYPITTNVVSAPLSNQSFKDIFYPKGVEVDEMTNTLFQVDEDGYYLYDSTINSACVVPDTEVEGKKKFEVYQELMSPVAFNYTHDDTKTYGNFLPYATKNIDAYEVLDANKKIYAPVKKNNNGKYESIDNEDLYHFGMEMETEFYQMQKGMKNDNPIKYEFSGDDDLWVYIDDVLVLDMGGCHDRRAGSIDFSTGIVEYDDNQDSTKENMVQTTLYELFKAAHMEDTVEWQDGPINDENGGPIKIFADYTKHSFKMWYLERGEGASNLKVRFNLPTIEPGNVEIEKTLTNSNKLDYANEEFQFQVYLQPISGSATGDQVDYDENATLDGYKLLTSELKTLEHRTEAVAYIQKAGSNEPEIYKLPTEEENGIFTLQPGDKLILKSLRKDRQYYVREVNVDKTEYDHTFVNGEEIVNTQKEQAENSGLKEENNEKSNIQSPLYQVDKNASVVFTNQCTDAKSNNLIITKQMASGEDVEAEQEETFTFRVSLENRNGVLEPYNGTYYLKNKEDQYLDKDYKPIDADSNTEKGTFSTTNGEIANVKIGYSIEITGVLSGTDFKVEETGLDLMKYEEPTITLTKKSYDFVDENSEALGSIKNGVDACVTVTNSYKVERNWEIFKMSENMAEDGTKNYLSGAIFKLTLNSVATDEIVENPSSDEQTTIPTYYGKSDENGKIVWYDKEDDMKADASTNIRIPAGEYSLEEIQAPTGFTISDVTWDVSINENNAVTIKDSTGNDVTNVGDITPKKEDGVLAQKLKFELTNKTLYELPSTGGSGIYWYIFGGILLMSAGSLILYKNKMRGGAGKIG